jgi:hypothetical protein
VFRRFPLPEGIALEFRAEAFNALNTVIYSAPVSDMTDPNFDRVIAAANKPRILQFALKVVF